MSDSNNQTDGTARPGELTPKPPTVIQLGPKGAIDLGGMTEQQQRALREEHARKEIERDDRTQRLAADVQVLGRSLETFTTNVLDAADKGISVTVTNTRDDHLGRTEVRMGNTEADKAGKFTRSQTGVDDSKFWIILAVIAGVVLIAVALVSQR